MKLKLDENLPDDLALFFRESGYDAMSVREQDLNGSPDRLISRICIQEQRILVSLDLDFADIRMYPPEEYAGLIVFRLKSQDRDSIIKASKKVIDCLAEETIRHCLWIVEDNNLRIRGGQD